MRIFIGLTDVANITANYAKGFRALGHEVFTVVWNKSRFYPDSEYDLVIDDRRQGGEQNRIIAYIKIVLRMFGLIRGLKCDLFILFAPAVLPTYIYYPILKGLGKKIITAFWGSDIRYWYAFAEEMKSLGVEEEVFPFFVYARDRSGGGYRDKLRTVEIAEKHSDLVISQPDCGQLQTRPYMRSNVPLDLSEYPCKVPGRGKPLILHAPSVPAAKGTDLIINTIKELSDEGVQFDFRLIENMPNRELRNLLTDSDIVVDELFSATVGALSSEAMASGNVVLVRYMAEYCKVPEGCPAINVNKFTLKENLREMILDVDKRMRLAHMGRAYVEKVNDHVKVCSELLEWLARKDELDYDFHPSFYKRFNLSPQLLLEEKQIASRKKMEFFKSLLNVGGSKNGG